MHTSNLIIYDYTTPPDKVHHQYIKQPLLMQRPSTYVSLQRTQLLEQLHAVLCPLRIKVLAFVIGNQIRFLEVIGENLLLILRQ